MRPLRIAMIGQRGIPATVGGVERHVEELGSRLADRGHQVTAFCRTNYTNDRIDEYRGIRIRRLPTVGTKHLDNIAHSALSTLAALPAHPDIVHYHAIGSALVSPLPRALSKSKVVLTVHGLDHERDKWGSKARLVLLTAAWMSARLPHATVVVSRALREHYEERYRRATHYIPNGVVAPPARPPDEIRKTYGLDGGDYFLFVGRLVPEKAPDMLLRAFRRVPGDVRLVIAGNSGFTDSFAESLFALGREDRRVLFTGAVHGPLLEELYANALAFVLPSRLEGLPLTLLEAASHGTPVVASDIPPHLEILCEDGAGHRLFRSGNEDELAEKLRDALTENRTDSLAGAEQMREQTLAAYSWDAVVEATESLYGDLLKVRTSTPSPLGAPVAARFPSADD